MDEKDLNDIFATEQIPQPDANSRKVHINLAVAAFENMQKNSKKSQGTGFFARLIHRQPDTRSEKMSFGQKKIIYGGMATACVALMIFAVLPEVTQRAESRIDGSVVPNSFKDIVAAKSLSEADAGAAMDARIRGNVANEADVAASAESVAQPELAKKEKVANFAAMPSGNIPTVSSVPAPAQRAVGNMIHIAPVSPTPPMPMEMSASQQQEFGRDNFKHVAENAIHQVVNDPVSTFSIDVDTASYSFMRSSLNNGVLPQVDSVRVEELINYFDYDYPLPREKSEPFSTNVVVEPSPWGEGKQILAIGIKGYDIPKTAMPNSNLVFLLDTSGSMDEPTKLPLLKQSIAMLLDTLKPTDTVSIVVYAGSAGTVLPPTKVLNKSLILNALQNLSAGGGTAGAEGIRQAYQLASVNFDKAAVNRVILGTDGDFNVGITDPNELKDFVSREKDKGIFLSVLGFGRGNYNDLMMQELAQNGNGTAAYIDNLNEARKVLVEEATKTLFPIAKDVKIQVEFNPATVAEYRLVGYETRALKTEDFNNDKVDAGDIGAGAEVTALYEFTPKGGRTAIDERRYAVKPDNKAKPPSAEIAFVKLRYKLPNENESKLITTAVAPLQEATSQVVAQEFHWAVAVASFAQLLKGGTYTGKMSYDEVLRLAEASKGADPFGYRAEFISLVRAAKTASGLEAQPNGQVVEQPIVIQPAVPYPYPVPQDAR